MIDAKYRAYLHSKEWKAKRQQLFKERGKKCEICGDTNQLEIHHITYDRLYNELSEDLLIVCNPCHSNLHKKKPKQKAPKKPKRSKKLNAKAKRKLAMKKAIAAERHNSQKRRR